MPRGVRGIEDSHGRSWSNARMVEGRALPRSRRALPGPWSALALASLLSQAACANLVNAALSVGDDHSKAYAGSDRALRVARRFCPKETFPLDGEVLYPSVEDGRDPSPGLDRILAAAPPEHRAFVERHARRALYRVTTTDDPSAPPERSCVVLVDAENLEPWWVVGAPRRP
jgi:hypothetical protein